MLAISMQSRKSFAILLLIFLVGLNHEVEGKTSPNDLEIERYLTMMNKPAVKTIKSPTGELIDCVDIYKQPSLDHPLLRNHKIQMKIEQGPSTEVDQAWHINGKCPEGTVPIQRIQKGDILRASSLQNLGKKSYPYSSKAATSSGLFAGVRARSCIFGAIADINLWNPKVQHDGNSNAQMWLSSHDESNYIEAGLMVNPALYDNETRLFTYWTNDNYKSTGCYNLFCQGFVQTSKDIALGAAMKPYSTYGGPQYQVFFKILQDPKSSDWWLTVQGKPVGYWPARLITQMVSCADSVQWGGHVNLNPTGKSFAEMGSGHFPGEGFGKAACFNNVNSFDQNGDILPPGEAFATKPQCYDVKQIPRTETFFYGGHGCP